MLGYSSIFGDVAPLQSDGPNKKLKLHGSGGDNLGWSGQETPSPSPGALISRYATQCLGVNLHIDASKPNSYDPT